VKVVVYCSPPAFQVSLSRHFYYLKQDCNPAHHLTWERSLCMSCVFPNQASWWLCEKLIFVDGVLCTLPWASWVGISLEKSSLCSYRGGIITKHTANSSDTKAALTSSLLVVSRGWSHSLLTLLTQTIAPETEDDLFHNKTRNWLLSAPVNWT